MPAYELTLGDLRSDSLIKSVSGVCNDSDRFADQVNAVTRRLMRKGQWFNTTAVMRLCIYGCYIVLPRQVGTLMGIRFCGTNADWIQIKNNWWSVASYKACNAWGRSSLNAVLKDSGTVPCYNEITGTTGKYIRWCPVKSNDVGKAMRIYGTQYGGQPLQEQNSAGEWVDGITLTLAAPYVQTTKLVTKITHVTLATATEGMTYLYQVDPSTLDLLDLAAYQPGETRPSYRSYRIENICSICSTKDDYDRDVRQADALVKLQYIKAVSDDDFVMLSNLDALALGIAALRAEEADDDVLAEIKWTKAVKELNLELRDKEGNMATVIRVNDLGANNPILNPI